MRKLLIFTLLLLIMNYCLADRVKTTDYFQIAGAVIDTSAGGTDIAPDSVRILVYFDGAEVYDAWYNTGDAQCAAGAGNDIVFFDQYGDIDADQGNGCYYVRAQFYAKDEELYHKADHYFELGLFGDTAQVNVAEAGDAMTLTPAERAAIEDTMANHASTYQPDSTLIDKIIDLALADYGVNAGKTGYSLASGGLSAVVTWALLDSLADTIWVNTKFVATIDSLGDTTWFKTHGDANWATSDGDTNQVNVPDSTLIDKIIDLALDAYNVACPGSSMTLTAAERVAISDSIWNEILTGATHNVATSAGRRLREGTGVIFSSGTAQSGGATWIVLASAESKPDDYYNSTMIILVDGTGEGQARVIDDYTGATDSVTLDDDDMWLINPDGTSEYVIYADVKGHVANMHLEAIDDIWQYPSDSIASGIGKEYKDTIQATIDSLQNISARLTVLMDSTQAILDSIQAGITAGLPDSSAGDISYIANNPEDYHADVSGCTGAGVGIYACSLYVLSTVDTSAIINCPVMAKSDGTETVIGQGTAKTGLFVFSQNAVALDYYAGALPGWTFTSPIDVTITGNQTDTIWGTPVSSTAPNADLVTIKFWVQPQSGTADTFSTVICKHRIVKADSSAFNYFTDPILTFGSGINTVVIDNYWTVDTTTTSYMEFYVYPNSDLSVSTSLYEFIVEHENDQIWRKIIAVPDTTTFNPFE